MFAHSFSRPELWNLFEDHWLGERCRRLKRKVKSLFHPKTLELALAYFTPTILSKDKSFLAPLVACVAVLGLVIFASWAVGALFQLLLSLSVIYFVVTKIFGIRVDVNA